MTRRRLCVAAGVLLPALAVLALLAYGFTREPRYIESPIVGRPAPSFALTLFDGCTVRLNDLRGQVVFIDSGRRGARRAGRMRRCSRRRGEASASRACFLEEFSISFPNGRDPGDRIAIDDGVWGLPEAFIVDPAGRITYKHIGTLGAVLLASKIDEARRGVASATQGRGHYQSTR